MQPVQEIFLILLTVYIILGTVIAMVSRRFGVKTTADYFVAGYRLGGFLASMTYAATTYSAFMMIGLVGLAFATGIASLGFELAYLMATMGILALIGPVIWRMARKRGWVSPSEMLSDLYGSNILGIVVAVLYLVALIPYTAAQLKGIGEIFRAVSTSYSIGIATAVGLVLLWVFIAGIWSVASTDAYQGIWMISASIAVVVWLLMVLVPNAGLNASGIVNVLGNTSSGNLLSNTWSPLVFIGYTVPWLFFALTNPQVVQRLYMPRDTRAYKRMLQYFISYGILYTAIVIVIGLAFRAYAVTALDKGTELYLIGHRDSVTPYMLTLANPVLAAFVFVSILAAAVSTANSIVLSVVSSITRDLYERRRSTPSPSVAKAVAMTSIVAMTIAAAGIALAKPTFIVELSVLSSALLLPLAPVILMGLARRPSRAGAISALAATLLGFSMILVAAFIIGARKALIVAWLGIPLPLWCLILTTAMVLASSVRWSR